MVCEIIDVMQFANLRETILGYFSVFLLRQKACLTWHVWLEYQRKKPPAKSPTPNLEDQACRTSGKMGALGLRGTWHNYKLKINSSENWFIYTHALEL